MRKTTHNFKLCCYLFILYYPANCISDSSPNLIKSFIVDDSTNTTFDTEIKVLNDDKRVFGLFNFLDKIISPLRTQKLSNTNHSGTIIKFDHLYSSVKWIETCSTWIYYYFDFTNNVKIETISPLTEINAINNASNLLAQIGNKSEIEKKYQTKLNGMIGITNISQTLMGHPELDIADNNKPTNSTSEDPDGIVKSKIVVEAVSSTHEITTEHIDENTVLSTTIRTESLNAVLDDYIFNDNDDQFTDYTYNENFYKQQNNVTSTSVKPSTESPVTDPGDYDFPYSVLPVEALNLCRTTKKQRTFINVERVVGLPVDRENYWSGYFDSGRFENLKKVEIVLQLISSVIVSAESNNVITTRLNDTTYLIKGLNASERVSFKVQAQPGQSFPFVKKVTLNGREICKKKRNWKPVLYGNQEQAVLSPLDSPHEFGPYFCGRSKIDFSPLVVKGLPTKEGDYPWHVALFIKNADTRNWDYACGGTIMTHKTIITAAHCVVNKEGVHIPRERLLIVAGKYRLYQVDKNQTPLKIKKIVVHENYTQVHNTLAHDLALLITEESIEYGMYVQPICHWNKKQADREVIFQEFGTVVGWGATENDTLSETLLAASLRAVPDSLCLKSRPSFFKRYLTKDTFCAGNRNGTSACNGDSGGGLIFPITEADGRQSWYLRGVVSAGLRRAGGLCDPYHYVVFTDVVRYSQWIEDNEKL